MEALFLQILNMSISASWLILAVILIRLLIQKAPKGFRYVLWALVAIRLLCPVFIESDFSLIPSQDVIENVGEVVKPIISTKPSVQGGNDTVIDQAGPSDIVQNQTPQNNATQENVGQNNSVQNNNVQNNTAQNTVETMKPSTAMSWIWVGGILALFMYAAVSYLQLRNTIKTSIRKEDNLWVCDGIQSPFILGLIRPQIYLPSYIEDNHIPYIVAHEKEHIRCKDHWWKPFGFILLMIHWFNPLVWVAYILMCRDIELACDERVIRSMGVEDKKNYSKSLLLCSNPRYFISACPVAFGEVGVKERIKKIVDYRKPSVWIIAAGVVICLILAVGFMTNPKMKELLDNTESTEENSEEPDTEENESDDLVVQLLKFLNDNENRMPNMFLFTEYTLAENVDLGDVFYCGADGMGVSDISEQEKQLLAQRYNADVELDIVKATTAQMDEVLQKYIGLTLEQTNKVGLEKLYYLEEYDAYYNVAGDTRYTLCAIKYAQKNENGLIVVEYVDGLSSYLGTKYQMTLRENDGNYQFVSNLEVQEVIEGESLSEEKLKWFETEFFNAEENRIVNQFLTSEYKKIEEIDLGELFYTGPNGFGGSGEVSDPEVQLLLDGQIEEIYTDITKVTTSQMNQILQKYTGLSLEQTNKNGLNDMYYLAEYDAYYMMHGDTNYNRYKIEKGFYSTGGIIALLYTKEFDTDENQTYIVTLKSVGDSYQFISNGKLISSESKE